MLLPAGGLGVNLCGGQIARLGTRAEATEMTGVALRAPSVCWLLRGAGEPPGRRVHRRAGSQSPPRGCYTSAEAARSGSEDGRGRAREHGERGGDSADEEGDRGRGGRQGWNGREGRQGSGTCRQVLSCDTGSGGHQTSCLKVMLRFPRTQ